MNTETAFTKLWTSEDNELYRKYVHKPVHIPFPHWPEREEEEALFSDENS